MDRFTYEQLRRNRAELRLPKWWYLSRTDRHKAKRMTVDQLISKRATKVLVFGNDLRDRMIYKRLPGPPKLPGF